jgi:hypothetical protein
VGWVLVWCWWVLFWDAVAGSRAGVKQVLKVLKQMCAHTPEPLASAAPPVARVRPPLTCAATWLTSALVGSTITTRPWGPALNTCARAGWKNAWGARMVDLVISE